MRCALWNLHHEEVVSSSWWTGPQLFEGLVFCKNECGSDPLPLPPNEYISTPWGPSFWSNWKLEASRKWYCMLWVALPIIVGNAHYRCQCILEGTMNDTGTARYRWQYTLQISRYKVFVSYRWCCMLQISLYVTGALYITRWHCKLQLAFHATGDIVV